MTQRDIKNTVLLIEVRTAPFSSKIIVEPDPFVKHPLLGIGEQVPGTPEGWTYLGCPVILTREPEETYEALLARAQREADTIMNDGFYRDVEY